MYFLKIVIVLLLYWILIFEMYCIRFVIQNILLFIHFFLEKKIIFTTQIIAKTCLKLDNSGRRRVVGLEMGNIIIMMIFLNK